MFRKSLAVLMVVAAGQLSLGTAQAQDFPGLGVGDMWANEVRFCNQFDQWNRQGSWALARMIPNDQPLPFNAMTISNSLSDGMRSFEGFNNNWHVNSNRTMNAIENWNYGAIREVAPFQNPYGGPVHMLPYQHNAYHQDAPGYIYQGENTYDYSSNFFPFGF